MDSLSGSTEMETTMKSRHDEGSITSVKTTNGSATRPPTQTLSFTAVTPARIDIRLLSVTVDIAPPFSLPAKWQGLSSASFKPAPQLKTLLSDISASFQPGTLSAILGGSGSGKTTFLNVLAERMKGSRVGISGNVLVNGDKGISNVRWAYVPQEDILEASLTVRETLMYSAALRLPDSISTEEKQTIVEQVILELGLKECADTRIGNSIHRGCSGGEKRRVSIAVQMLSNPSLLFLDEPTTGLDATSAFQLARTLQSLAKKGRTVVMTVHQPRSEIWECVDGLVVLSKGSLVYAGSRKECLSWFKELGHVVGEFVNPAEWVVDLAAYDNRSTLAEEESTKRVDGLKEAWAIKSKTLYPAMSVSEKTSTQHTLRPPASTITQIRIQTHRTLITTLRDPLGLSSALLEATLMGIVTGYIFYSLSRDASGIRSREGALYSAAALQGYLMLLFEVYRVTLDIPLFDRERNDGCVGPMGFIISRRLARFLTEDVPVPAIFSIILYFMAGFTRTPERFFTFFAISFLNHYIAMTCGMFCVCLARDFPTASLYANLIYTVQSLACGMFIQGDEMPVYLRWIKYITYSWYAIGAYAGNEFQGSFYDCPYSNDPTDPACTSYTGAGIMKDFGFPQDWIAKPILVLVAFILFFLVTSYFILRFSKVSMEISRARTGETIDMSAGKETVSTKNVSVRPVDVSLKSFSLSIQKRNPLGKNPQPKTILHDINATFHAGTLNVIMGPSGSGKTSLLNSLALRLSNTSTTKYLPSSTPLLNGAIPTPSVLRSLTSYVPQDDAGLLPSLTVRETLRFAAALRLPSFMTSAEKRRRADEVLLKLGLKDCADVLVGSELVKGISGGEKRRVSIAVQILTEPGVLLLDEPTSGLDAFTAGSLMAVLEGLAKEGRTLILTIHQARSDLFTTFGNVLLLARGGHPVYAGPPGNLLPYFSNLGFECPGQSNPADFALDLITVDLQESTREVESRKRVTSLITAWDLKIRKDSMGDIPGHVTKKISSPAELGASLRTPTPLYITVPLLLRRNLINLRRQPPALIARLTQVLSLGVLMALFFSPLHHSYPSIQTRMGLVQQTAGFYFTGLLQNVAVYPMERDVFYREFADGVYGVNAFLSVYTLLEIPFEVISAGITAIIIVFSTGLSHSASLIFTIILSIFTLSSTGESIGILFNTLFPSHTGFAITLTSVIMSLANSMSGVLSTDMPKLLKGANWMSPVRYVVRAVAVLELKGVEFTCDEGQMNTDGTCLISTGEDALELYHLRSTVKWNIVGLAVCVVTYRLIAWIVVWLSRRRWES